MNKAGLYDIILNRKITPEREGEKAYGHINNRRRRIYRLVYLHRAFAGGGEEIVVADNFSNSKPAALDRIREITGKEFKFYKADMRCGEELERIFEENEISEAIHFAGLKAVGESVQKPLMYYDNNVSGTVNLLKNYVRQWSKSGLYSVRRLLFTESLKACPLKRIFL